MAKEFPEAELVRKTYTLRAMDLPPNVTLTKRSLLRWFALAFGLISEKESRSTILDVLDALFYFQLSKGAEPTTQDIIIYLKNKNTKISEKLLRYHIKRLTDIGLLQRRKMKLSFSNAPHAEKADLIQGFQHNISSPVNSSLKDIESVLEKITQSYRC